MSSEVETVFRREWGRAVAVVTRLTGDLGLAEDAVQEAFALALDRWADGPLPSDPSGVADHRGQEPRGGPDSAGSPGGRPRRRPPRGCLASAILRRPSG